MVASHSKPHQPAYTCKLLSPDARRLVMAFERLPAGLQSKMLHSMEVMSSNYPMPKGGWPK
jgi:hypothetical protein